jgi:hypothetical protein
VPLPVLMVMVYDLQPVSLLALLLALLPELLLEVVCLYVDQI